MLSRPSLAIAAVLAVVGPACAQRGRGRSEAIQNRVGSFFLEAKLPPAGEGEGKDRLAALPLVQDAKAQRQLAFLYLYDSSVEEPKREAFDRIVFGNDEVGVSLRCFRCAHVDIAGDAEARARYGRKLPVFVAFDENGKCVGEASLPGYKAALGPVTDLLEKAAQGHVKPTLAAFTKDYRDIVRGLELLEGKRRTLHGRRERADDKKKVLLDKEAKEVDAEEERLLVAEKQLLAKVKLPERDANAKRLGGDPRGGR